MTQESIKTRLIQAYPDAVIMVEDLTGGGDHYSVFIRSHSFKGMSRIKVHQEVLSVFDTELKSGEIHAFTLKTEVPE